MMIGFPGWLSTVPQFLSNLAQVIGLALGFTLDLPQKVLAFPHPWLLALAVAVLAGVSQLVGDSVILFVNRVRPARFIAALGLNGLLFALSLAAEGVVIWLSARFLFGADEPVGMGILVAFLGSAPLVFGFFIMAATLGPVVGRLLRIWSWLITLLAVRDGFDLALWQALASMALAWFVVWLINLPFGRMLGLLNEVLWRLVTRAPIGLSPLAQQRLRTGETQREMVLTLSDKLRDELMALARRTSVGEQTE
jgi:MFS family permease